MVGYNKSRSKETQLGDFEKGSAGVISGVITRTVTQPFDVLKIRFQLQHEPLRKGNDNYYWNLKQATGRILSEESFSGLWKGHVPAQILSGIYGLAQFGSFELMTRLIFTKLTDNYKGTTHFICGGVSGGLATVLTMPLDTIRTRLVCQGEPKIYHGIVHAFSSMVRVEGIKSLYKGLVPNLVQIVPYAGMQFGFFNLFSEIYRHLNQTEPGSKLPMFVNMVAGSCSGLLSKAGIYPMDLAKKRLQVQGFETARSKFGKVKKYNGLRHCLISTIHDEGFRGLYKGLLPSSLKAILTTGLIFSLYEEITNLYILLRK